MLRFLRALCSCFSEASAAVDQDLDGLSHHGSCNQRSPSRFAPLYGFRLSRCARSNSSYLSMCVHHIRSDPIASDAAYSAVRDGLVLSALSGRSPPSAAYSSPPPALPPPPPAPPPVPPLPSSPPPSPLPPHQHEECSRDRFALFLFRSPKIRALKFIICAHCT
jgi:hypothetical protein